MRSLLLLIVAFFTINVLAQDSETSVSAGITEEKSEDHLNDLLNLRINEPHFLLINELNVETLFKLNSHFAAGPIFGVALNADTIRHGGRRTTYIDVDDTTDRYSVGARVVYYFNHVNRSGAYISAFGRYTDAEVELADSSTFGKGQGAKFNETTYGLVSGYQWQVGPLRMTIGGGLQIHNAPKDIGMNFRFNTSSDSSALTSDHRLQVGERETTTSLVIDGGIGITF